MAQEGDGIRDELVEEVLKVIIEFAQESPEFESEAEDEGFRKTLKEITEPSGRAYER
jgi:hypothetical protein